MIKRKSLTITFLVFSSITFLQTKMRTVEELVNKTDSGWEFVKKSIDSAKNKIEILPVDFTKAKDALFKSQVTTRSSMGAIIYETGGILIDNGWIRLLGSGHERLSRSLPDWNKGKTLKEFGQQPPYLLIGDDVLGGFFLLNGGGLGDDVGKVYYFSPDNLEYERLDMTYTEFLSFCFNGKLEDFYRDYRWIDWETDISKLSGDEVFNFFPCLWTKEGKNLEKNSRKPVPIEEQYFLNIEFRKQLGIEK